MQNSEFRSEWQVYRPTINLGKIDYQDVTGTIPVEPEEWEQLQTITPRETDLSRRISRRPFTWQEFASARRSFEEGERRARSMSRRLRMSKLVFNLVQLTAATLLVGAAFTLSRSIYDESRRPGPWYYEPDSCKVLKIAEKINKQRSSSGPYFDFYDVQGALFERFLYLKDMQVRDRNLQPGQIRQDHPLYRTVGAAVSSYSMLGDTELTAYYLTRDVDLDTKQKAATLAKAYRNYAKRPALNLAVKKSQDPYQESHWLQDLKCSNAIADGLQESTSK